MVGRTGLLLVGLTAVAACSEDETPQATLQVSMTPTSGRTASGTLTVTDTRDGLHITGRLANLPPGGPLGFHIHETGDCSAPDASSAGDHFNPTQQPHGHPDGTARHAGDMPNLEPDRDGTADVDVTLASVRIDAPAAASVRGRALIVHAAPDDYTTQPSGGSGDRIACGVIGATARP